MTVNHQELKVSLSEIRVILERRKKAALETAERAQTPRFKQASSDEGAFFGSLLLLMQELETARTLLLGDPTRSLADLPAAMSSGEVCQMLGELQGLLTLEDQVTTAAWRYDPVRMMSGA